MENWNCHSSLLDDTKDPATASQELMQKLENNFKMGQEKLSQVFRDFVKKQESMSTQDLEKECEESDNASTDTEHKVTSSNLQEKENSSRTEISVKPKIQNLVDNKKFLKVCSFAKPPETWSSPEKKCAAIMINPLAKKHITKEPEVINLSDEENKRYKPKTFRIIPREKTVIVGQMINNYHIKIDKKN